MRKLRIQEEAAEIKLLEALKSARNRHRMEIVAGDIHKTEGLPAWNPRSHTMWGSALWRQLRSDNIVQGNEDLFFITLVDVECGTLPFDQPLKISWMIERYRNAMRTLNFVGVIEPAFYTNIAPGTDCTERHLLLWHLHAICWGASQMEIKHRIKELNEKSFFYKPVIPTLFGAHAKKIKQSLVRKKFIYMLRSPTKVYRIYRRTDPSDPSKQGFVSRSTMSMRPGERLIYAHALINFRIDRLTLAGGDGVAIRRRALRSLLLR